MLFAIYFAQETNIAGVIEDKTITMTIQQAHECPGHPNEDATRKTAKLLNW
jgi:hypothetical protein